MSKVPPTPSQRVYVSFIPTNITESEVRSMFELFGPINIFQFYQRKDGFTYAHITYEHIQSAHEAILVMHKKKLQDKFLNVTFASGNCLPKWKRIKQSKEKGQDIEPTEVEQSVYDIGRKASKKTIKREKQRQRAMLRKLLQTAPNPLEYLDKIEEALRDVLKLKEQLLALKEEEKSKKKKETKPAEQKNPQKQVDSKVSLADLEVFKSWLNFRKEDEGKNVDEGAETEWDDNIDFGEPEDNQVQ